MNRHFVHLQGVVSQRSVAKIAPQLQMGGKLIISSHGGDLDAARILIDTVRALKITTQARGVVASSAAAIFRCGTKRIAEPSSIFIIHEPRFSLPPNLTRKELETYLRNAILAQEMYSSMFGIALTEREIGAREALELGIATRIATKKDFTMLNLQPLSNGEHF